MHKAKEDMDSNIVWHIVGWSLAAVAAVAGAYACYKYSDRLKALFSGDKSGHDASGSKSPRETASDDIERLRDECWDTYVKLQTVLSKKEACRKRLVGDTGIETALAKLKSILASGRDDAYMAPRITDQVCGFISNTLVAGGMIGTDGTVMMPDPKPALMERDVYFRNITVSPDEQAEKYRKVADYQRQSIKAENSDTRFIDTLRALLPWLQQAYDLAEGKTTLTPERTVAWGKEFIDKSSQIIAKYEK